MRNLLLTWLTMFSKPLQWLLAVEGVAHIVTAVLCFSELYTLHSWEWKVLITGITDFLFAFTAMAGSLGLRIFEHRHDHTDKYHDIH